MPVALLCLLLVSGCAARGILTEEYVLTTLSPRADEIDVGAAPPSKDRDLAVGVGPIELPRYLSRPQIVTREGNRLHASDRHQWGGDLQSDLARVLAENLARRIPTDRVSNFLWADPRHLDYRVAAQVTQFERDSSGAVHLVAHWQLLPGAGGQALHVGRSSIRTEPSDDSYSAAVEAMSAAVAALSDEIADSIRAQKR